MKAKFDILTQPWIPVIDKNGVAQEIGLLEALEQAHTYQSIRDTSPMVEYSVYRFLIVFLMDMLRPEDEDDLDGLLTEGCFDPDVIQEYITTCKQEGVSFDLFHPERPFLQTTYQKDWDREPKSVTVLDYSIPNGNNHIHFDHKCVSVACTPGKALRLLLAAQIFCTAAAQGYPSNVNGAPPWFTLIQGRNLFETLVFGMLETDRIELPLDCPPVLWRNFDEVIPKQKVARTSWLFGMYFPARRIHLIPSEDGHSVSSVYFSQGMNYEVTDAWEDPHVTYRITKKGRANWKPSDDETIWRNLTDLIDTQGKRAPQIVAQYEYLDTFDRPLSLTLYGVQTNQANYLKAQRHDLQIPKQLLGKGDALEFTTEYIKLAEGLGQTLYKSLTHEEIAEESRLQARQQYYAFCERLLWKQFDAMAQLDFNCKLSSGMAVNALYQEAVNALCQEAVKSADWILEQLTLRGKTMLQVMGNQQKILRKEIAIIKKEMKR